jgi:hypothetical protein
MSWIRNTGKEADKIEQTAMRTKPAKDKRRKSWKQEKMTPSK